MPLGQQPVGTCRRFRRFFGAPLTAASPVDMTYL